MSEWRSISELRPEMSEQGRLYLRFRNGEYGPGHHNPDGSLHYYGPCSIPTHFQIIDRVPEEMVLAQVAELDSDIQRERAKVRAGAVFGDSPIPMLLKVRAEFTDGIDREVVEQRLADLRSGESDTVPLEEVKRKHGVDGEDSE